MEDAWCGGRGSSCKYSLAREKCARQLHEVATEPVALSKGGRRTGLIKARLG